MDLEIKLVNSVKSVLDSIPLSSRNNAPVYTVFTAGTIVPPYILVSALGGQETPLDTGNFNQLVNVEIRSPADPKGTVVINAHGTTVYNVYQKIDNDGFADDLSAATGFHCIGVFDRKDFPQQVQQRHFISQRQFMAYCCATDL